jgi:hypothetical protein
VVPPRECPLFAAVTLDNTYQRFGLRRSLKSNEIDTNPTGEHSLGFHSAFGKLSTFRSGYIQDDHETLDAYTSWSKPHTLTNLTK